MTIDDIRYEIDTMLTDMVFDYNGKSGSICPFSRENIALAYDGNFYDAESVDEAMNAKFIGGHSLAEIGDRLEF